MAEYPWFPLFIHLAGRNIVVVGGGKIARRRILTLLDFTERVTVVAPELHPELLELESKGRLTVRRRAYEAGDLEGAELVLAATDDPSVNEKIGSDCKALGIPVNVSSDRSRSDFYFPGIARKGGLVAGVTAGGTDHAGVKRLTEAIRRLLAQFE